LSSYRDDRGFAFTVMEMNIQPYRASAPIQKSPPQKKYRAVAYPPFDGCFDDATKYFDEQGKVIPKVLGEYDFYVIAWIVAWLFTINNTLTMVEIQKRSS
jgi:hypothetical protein